MFVRNPILFVDVQQAHATGMRVNLTFVRLPPNCGVDFLGGGPVVYSMQSVPTACEGHRRNSGRTSVRRGAAPDADAARILLVLRRGGRRKERQKEKTEASPGRSLLKSESRSNRQSKTPLSIML